jgi:hypothetical protein
MDVYVHGWTDGWMDGVVSSSLETVINDTKEGGPGSSPRSK